MTTCKDSIELLRAYLDGELPPSERERLESHFGDCTPCEEFLATYRATPSICKEALKKQMPEAVASRLRAFIRTAACGCKCRDEAESDEKSS